MTTISNPDTGRGVQDGGSRWRSLVDKVQNALTRDVLDHAVDDLLAEEWIALAAGDRDRAVALQRDRGLHNEIRLMWS